MEGNDNLDGFFKSKLEDGQANVPADSWQAISQKISVGNKKKSRGLIVPLPFFWIALSFLMGSIAGAVSFYAYDLKTENERLRSQIYNNQQILKTNNHTNSGFYKPSQSFNNKGLKISDGFLETLNSKYRFRELLIKPEESSYATSGYYRQNRVERNQNRKSVNEHIASRTNYTETGEDVYNNIDSGSELNTLQALNDEANNLPEIVEGNKNAKSGKPDSLTFKPDSVINIIPIAKAEQENKIKKAIRVFGFPISAGIYVTPEMASRSINFSENTDPELVKYKQKDERKFGFSAGLNLDIHLPKNFFIRTGINYWNVGEKNTILLKHTDYDTTESGINTRVKSSVGYGIPPANDSIPSNTYTYNPTTGQYIKVNANAFSGRNTQITESVSQFSSTISNNYHYLGIPVLLGMKMSNKKLSFGLFSGLITNVLISPSSSVYYVYYDPEQPEKFIQAKRELSRFLLVYSGGMDFDYKITKQWTVNISPNIKYSVTSIYKDASVKQLPYSFGIQFGVKCKIGN